jgi:hypothetical protein
VTVKCPIGRCDYVHKFPETDLTINDALTVERRAAWLRLHHKADHPMKINDPKQLRRAMVFNTLTRSLADAEEQVSTQAREDATTAILHSLDSLK